MITQWISGFYIVFQHWGLVGIFISMFLENIAFPLPIEIGYLSGAYMIEKGIHSYWLVMVVLTAGHMFGAATAYAAGKYGSHWLEYRLRNNVSFAAIEQKIHYWYEKYGDYTAFGVRFFGYVRLFSSYIAGLAEYNFWRFIIFTTAGSLLFNMLGISASKVLMDVWSVYTSLHIYIVLGLSISFFVCIGWGIIQKRKRAPSHNQHPVSE